MIYGVRELAPAFIEATCRRTKGKLRKPRNEVLRPGQKRSLHQVNEHFVEGA